MEGLSNFPRGTFPHFPTWTELPTFTPVMNLQSWLDQCHLWGLPGLQVTRPGRGRLWGAKLPQILFPEPSMVQPQSSGWPSQERWARKGLASNTGCRGICPLPTPGSLGMGLHMGVHHGYSWHILCWPYPCSLSFPYTLTSSAWNILLNALLGFRCLCQGLIWETPKAHRLELLAASELEWGCILDFPLGHVLVLWESPQKTAGWHFWLEATSSLLIKDCPLS